MNRSNRPVNRIEATFERLKAKREKALIAYLMAGDPSLQETEALVLELERAGADLIELGVPFSDPIADGPVIQKAAERALRSGTSLRRILSTVSALRTRTQIPLVLMAYYNTIHALGEEAFCRQAVAAGVDGVIVPDMPPEEAGPLEIAAAEAGPLLIFLLAPTSTPARRAMVARRSRGFLYYVSLTGITGAKLTDVGDVRKNVAKIRQVTNVPVAVGFGVATAEDAARVARIADGVIVGSAIVRQIGEHQHDPRLPEHVGQFVRSLKNAMHSVSAPTS
ncbi:MAG: tryptophan synthase subunit alpha [Nitrospirae bacterium]|nr:tryptophan synthase subunit alpha [Nitrospirota bacterium]